MVIDTLRHVPESLSVALPVYNEQDALPGVVKEIVNELGHLALTRWEIVLVDDGSTDKSADQMQILANRYPNIRIVSHGARRGFAAVQRSCYQHSRCDWIFLLPADGQILPTALQQLLPYCNEADVVCGTVRRSQENTLGEWMSRLYHCCVTVLFGLNIGRFGACILIRRELAQQIEVRARTPVAMTELLLRARAQGAKIKGVEVQKQPRRYGRNEGGYLLGSSFRILGELVRLRLRFSYSKS